MKKRVSSTYIVSIIIIIEELPKNVSHKVLMRARWILAVKLLNDHLESSLLLFLIFPSNWPPLIDFSSKRIWRWMVMKPPSKALEMSFYICSSVWESVWTHQRPNIIVFFLKMTIPRVYGLVCSRTRGNTPSNHPCVAWYMSHTKGHTPTKLPCADWCSACTSGLHNS